MCIEAYWWKGARQETTIIIIKTSVPIKVKLILAFSKQVDVERLITESCQLWRQFDTECKNLKENDSAIEESRGLRFWKPASENKLYLSDIERFLKIIRTEKWLGQTGIESLQKMSIALLETIESKTTLIETLSRINKTRGSRLQSLIKSSFGNDGDDEDQDEVRQNPGKQILNKSVENSLTASPEIDFEQPNRTSTAEDSLISIANVKLKRNRKC